MNHLTGWGLDQASDNQRRHEAERAVDEVLACARQPLIEVVVIFFANPIGPLSLMTLEMALLELVREIGRQLLELVLNTCEPDRPDELPQHVRFECGGYRRRNQKTANRNVASRFGDIVLHRYGYRSWQAGEGSLFPLAMLLGLNHSATPALVDWIGRHIATAGSNQVAVIGLLRTDCNVTMGVKRLRQCVNQLGQATMDQMLTDLITELLERYDGPLPRLAYVTDSGSNETGYFEKVLRRMVHPRTGARLEWTRVADYYHASERIWTMAEVLFGKGTRAANAWAHRMLKSLKKPSGVSRVLHSAASHFHHRQRKSRKLSRKKEEIYWTAYRYIQSRATFMRYSEYRSVHPGVA